MPRVQKEEIKIRRDTSKLPQLYPKEYFMQFPHFIVRYPTAATESASNYFHATSAAGPYSALYPQEIRFMNYREDQEADASTPCNYISPSPADNMSSQTPHSVGSQASTPSTKEQVGVLNYQGLEL